MRHERDASVTRDDQKRKKKRVDRWRRRRRWTPFLTAKQHQHQRDCQRNCQQKTHLDAVEGLLESHLSPGHPERKDEQLRQNHHPRRHGQPSTGTGSSTGTDAGDVCDFKVSRVLLVLVARRLKREASGKRGRRVKKEKRTWRERTESTTGYISPKNPAQTRHSS